MYLHNLSLDPFPPPMSVWAYKYLSAQKRAHQHQAKYTGLWLYRGGATSPTVDVDTAAPVDGDSDWAEDMPQEEEDSGGEDSVSWSHCPCCCSDVLRYVTVASIPLSSVYVQHCVGQPLLLLCRLSSIGALWVIIFVTATAYAVL